ncbi:MAG: proton-conducting transporter membrane subunit [Thermoguttaceae bacterium]
MDLNTLLPRLLALAWLLPLGSFALIVFFGPRMGRAGRYAAHVATSAIIAACVLSFAALGLWLFQHPLTAGHGAHAAVAPPHLSDDWYSLGDFGSLRVTVGYYIDSLTLCMFCMVTLVASCIHVYSTGYMHGELHDVFDTFGPTEEGRMIRRRGRYCRFFQCLSLFCFSMLGLVIAGNVAMVFAFWELVGICSYLLIGFWHERKSASNAANKAFIVNRVGDFGMIVGMMAVWAGFGTFSFGDYCGSGRVLDHGQVVVKDRMMPGIFSQARPAGNVEKVRVPDGMVQLAARDEVKKVVAAAYRQHSNASEAMKSLSAEKAVRRKVGEWREQGYGYWLLVVGGLGIFCGCVGKSAQFPLHVWLPDAMEGPTPVSALIHAATMVAAGVYLVGRFYPVFTPEVLLVIACVGCVTLFMAATIALTATDIKRVLAYSTVSQLGFMMLALGLGGWLAGMFHLFTHAFFKSLLFLCSGSVIHACGTNEMPSMGGLRRKMPITAMTMLIGCLAIAGAGIPTVIGLSGFYSKDSIIAQGLSFWAANPRFGGLFFYTAVCGAGLTAFYMFRLWYMTFAGNARDGDVYYHAHESPLSMTVPLMILALMAVVVGWNIPFTKLGLEPLLRQAAPLGIAEGASGGLLLPGVHMPAEHLAHEHANAIKAELAAFGVALFGFLAATWFFGLRKLDPADVCRTFPRTYRFLVRKWMFDELYAFCFVRPVLRISGWIAAVDRKGIDWCVDGSARLTEAIARFDDAIDRVFVDRAVNLASQWTYALGIRLRKVETGSIRQYVLWLAVGLVALVVLTSLFWSNAVAGG